MRDAVPTEADIRAESRMPLVLRRRMGGSLLNEDVAEGVPEGVVLVLEGESGT